MKHVGHLNLSPKHFLSCDGKEIDTTPLGRLEIENPVDVDEGEIGVCVIVN